MSAAERLMLPLLLQLPHRLLAEFILTAENLNPCCLANRASMSGRTSHALFLRHAFAARMMSSLLHLPGQVTV